MLAIALYNLFEQSSTKVLAFVKEILQREQSLWLFKQFYKIFSISESLLTSLFTICFISIQLQVLKTNKDKYVFTLKLEKACRTNKEMKNSDSISAVSKKIPRFQNTQNNWGAKPLMSHTFSVKSPLDHRNNVQLIALIFSSEV